MNTQDWAGREGGKRSSAVPDQHCTDAPESRWHDCWRLFQLNCPMILCGVFSATEAWGRLLGNKTCMAWSFSCVVHVSADKTHTSNSKPHAVQPFNHSWLFWWYLKVCLCYFSDYPSFSGQKDLRSRVGRAKNRLTSWPNGETGLKRKTKPHILYPSEIKGPCFFPGYRGFMGY